MAQNSKAMERITAIADEGSFMETGGRVTARSTDFARLSDPVPGDGVVTGFATVNEVPVAIFAEDPEVLGGSFGEMHARKIENIYETALKTGIPVVGLMDSAGLRLEEATDALDGYGRLFRVMAEASGRIPMISVLYGRTGGGMAIAAGLSDFVLMEKSAELFVNAPNTLAGNYREKCDTAAADYQMKECGTVDFVGTEEELTHFLQELFWHLPVNSALPAEEDTEDDLNRMTDELNGETDIRAIFKAVGDEGVFTELKKDHAPSVVTGFAALGGETVALVGFADSRISAAGLRKATSFIRFADAFSMPVVTFSGSEGYEATVEEERELVRSASDYAATLASATVPKINVYYKDIYGSAYALLNSRSLGADFVFAYPDLKIGVMKAEDAARILGGGDTLELFKERESVEFAARRGIVDEIVEPRSLRKKLLQALGILSGKLAGAPDRKHPGK